MSTIIPKNDLIDDLYLHKHIASSKMCNVLSFIKDHGSKKMVKTASTNDQIIALFSNMLNCLNMNPKEDNVKELINKIATDSTNIDKEASSKERKTDIKIASKHVKDSHYQIDISKDIIQKDGKKMFMVSCYARDAYLGRYLIKRNYFYTTDREKFADNSYDEILTKVSSIKDRYYNEIINVSGILPQIKQVLDGVISEIEIKEDSLGTTVRR